MSSPLPRTIHHVWQGDGAPRELMGTWARLNPTWEHRVWNGTERSWRNAAKMEEAERAYREGGFPNGPNPARDFYRYEILAECGGVYVDADSECLRSLDELPQGASQSEAWGCYENETVHPGMLSSAFLAGRPSGPAWSGSSLFEEMVKALGSADFSRSLDGAVGPSAWTRVAERHPELLVLPARTFQPVYWQGTPAPGGAPVFGVHYWGGVKGVERDPAGRRLWQQTTVPLLEDFMRTREPTTRLPESYAFAVTVVIPCHGYSSESFLNEAVRSVMEQTFREEVEIVIVAGDGEAAELARVYEGGNVQVITGAVAGLSDARNRGIAAARSPFVVTLDADDMLFPIFLERSVRAARAASQETSYVVVTAPVARFGGGKGRWAPGPEDWPRIIDQNAVATCSLFTRALWSVVGGYDVSLLGWEDWDFWIRCSEVEGIRVLYLRDGDEEAHSGYRVHKDSMSHWDIEHRAGEAWHAMIRLRHPSLYARRSVPKSGVRFSRERDLETMQAIPAGAMERLRKREAQFPEHWGLRSFLRLAGEAKAARPPVDPFFPWLAAR